MYTHMFVSLTVYPDMLYWQQSGDQARNLGSVVDTEFVSCQYTSVVSSNQASFRDRVTCDKGKLRVLFRDRVTCDEGKFVYIYIYT